MLQKTVLKHAINCPTDLAKIYLVHTQSLFFYSVTPSHMRHNWLLNCFVLNTLYTPEHLRTWSCSSGPDWYPSKVRKELVIDCLKISSKYSFWGCGEHTKCHPQTRSQYLFEGLTKYKDKALERANRTTLLERVLLTANLRVAFSMLTTSSKRVFRGDLKAINDQLLSHLG